MTGDVHHTVRGIDQLITMVTNGSVQGFLIDRNTYYHFSKRIEAAPKYSHIKTKMHKVKVTSHSIFVW